MCADSAVRNRRRSLPARCAITRGAATREGRLVKGVSVVAQRRISVPRTSGAKRVGGRRPILREVEFGQASPVTTADRQLRRISITGFRSARDTTFEPGAVCALIGEANAGKSNVLAAIWRLLQPQAPPPGRSDFWRGDEAIRITATLEDGQELSLEVA